MTAFLDAHLPHGGRSDWEVDDPQIAAVLHEAFSALELSVAQVTAGEVADETGMKAASEQCVLILKD